MKKIKLKIKETSRLTTVLETDGKTISIPTEYLRKPKLGEMVVLTLASEKEDAMKAKEVAHELIKTALRGE